MKKIFSLFILATIISFSSCDRIKSPIVKKNTLVGTSFKVKNNFAVSNYKKTLLEDYTAMRCLNCPGAAVVAKNLLASYGNSLIVIAVHAGSLAKPFGLYTADYRTDAGEKWSGTAGYAISSYPSGLINRTAYPPNGVVVSETSWSGIVNTAKNDPFIVKLDVTTKYDTAVGALNTEVNAIFKQAYSSNLKILITVTEDGVVGRQLDGSVDIEEYEFEHMLRGAVNGDWGADLTTTPKAINDTVKYAFNDFNLNGMTFFIDKPDPIADVYQPIVVNDKNISVVVFVYNATTKEVLQVEKVKIR